MHRTILAFILGSILVGLLPTIDYLQYMLLLVPICCCGLCFSGLRGLSGLCLGVVFAVFFLAAGFFFAAFFAAGFFLAAAFFFTAFFAAGFFLAAAFFLVPFFFFTVAMGSSLGLVFLAVVDFTAAVRVVLSATAC